MDLTGEYRIAAPRETVWRALNDPEILKQCIPGCETLEKTSETEFAAKVGLKIGPVSAKFGGKVTLSDLDPPRFYRISGEGSGGIAGFAKGSAEVTLTEDGPTTTILAYSVAASVGGKIAQIGARLIDGTARKLADDFFDKFATAIAANAAAPTSTADFAAATDPTIPVPATADDATAVAKAETQSRRLPPWAWIAGLIVATLILLWFYGR